MSGVKIDSVKVAVKVQAEAGRMVDRAANRVSLRTRASMLGQGRLDTLEMINSMTIVDVTKDPRRPTRRVSNKAKHFPYQELGTPKEAPGVGRIYPKRPGGFLRFRPKGSSVFVYARSVRGVVPGHFLRRAAAATQAKDFSEPL